MKRTLVSTLLLLSLIAAPRLHAVVISEIFYFPADGDIALEFVEIANESSTPEDISGFHFTSGIRYEFPPGTILEGRARIAVAANATALRAEYDIDNAVGNFEGRLDRNGERLTLADFQGVEVTTVRYR
ncbi:MAG: lamin tail domain-containing protein, partial [Planctomycetota bacterium]